MNASITWLYWQLDIRCVLARRDPATQSQLASQELRPPMPEAPILLLVRSKADDNIFSRRVALLLQAFSNSRVQSPFLVGVPSLLEYLDDDQPVRPFDSESCVVTYELVRLVLRDDLEVSSVHAIILA